jgi:purine-binding chemotaxis protein CheW
MINTAIAGQLVVFELESQRFALPLEQVERATRSVALTPLSHAPAVIAGVIEMRGAVVPVIDMRRRLRLPLRALALTDQLLIARTATRRYAVLVDAVLDVVAYTPADYVETTAVVPGLEYLQGIVRLPDGIVLIHDLEQFLSLAENRALDEALANA